MNGRFPRLGSRLRIFVPLAVLVMILGGASAAFASGAFESNDSGFDSARDVAERGTVAASTTTTSLPAVNDDNGVAAPSAATPTPAQDETSANVPDGATATFAAGEAGSVTIRRAGGALTVVSVNANPTWVFEIEQGSGTEIEVKFVNGATRIDFNAELEDGAVRVRVGVRADDSSTPGTIGDDNSGPGNASDDRSTDDNSGPGNADDDSSSGHGSNSGPGSSGHSRDD